MKTILSIIPYGMTAHDFFVLRDPIKDKPNRHFFNSLPEWCIRDNGFIDYTENWHQFTGLIDSKDETVYHLFDINPIDEILREEINQMGVEGILEGYDFTELFKQIPLNENPYNSIRIPFNVHIVVELDYIGKGEDTELFIEVLGYLDNNMEFKRIIL
jgi:hypothetical protein